MSKGRGGNIIKPTNNLKLWDVAFGRLALQEINITCSSLLSSAGFVLSEVMKHVFLAEFWPLQSVSPLRIPAHCVYVLLAPPGEASKSTEQSWTFSSLCFVSCVFVPVAWDRRFEQNNVSSWFRRSRCRCGADFNFWNWSSTYLIKMIWLRRRQQYAQLCCTRTHDGWVVRKIEAAYREYNFSRRSVFLLPYCSLRSSDAKALVWAVLLANCFAPHPHTQSASLLFTLRVLPLTCTKQWLLFPSASRRILAVLMHAVLFMLFRVHVLLILSVRVLYLSLFVSLRFFALF